MDWESESIFGPSVLEEEESEGGASNARRLNVI